MKVVVAGAGKIGKTLTGLLSAEGHEVTIIDKNAGVLEKIMEQYDVMGVEGNAASMSVLSQANVKDADLLIAATDMDEINLLSCMTAHGMNPDLHTIGRIRNPEYRQQAYVMRDVFALNLVINPERQAAREIARLLKYPGFLKIDTLAKGNVEIVELRIDEKSPLKNASLNDLNSIIHCQVLICAVLRDDKCIMPGGSFVLQEGDLIFVTASTVNLSTLLRNLGIIARKAKRVLVAGGGRISYYLVEELQKSGMHCTIVERDPDRCAALADILPDATIVEGDASSQGFLDSEGLGDCDALVTMTGLDELNIVISLYAHSRNVTQIVTKLSRAEKNKILSDLPIGSVIMPKELASNTIVRYVRAMDKGQGAAITVHAIANGKAEAIEFIVDKETAHRGELLKNIRTRDDVLIVSIASQGRVSIPNGSSSFQEGDDVVIVTNNPAQIRTMNDIFEA